MSADAKIPLGPQGAADAPKDCPRRERRLNRCPFVKCTYEGMDGERYRCSRCDHSYFLDYEEMR